MRKSGATGFGPKQAGSDRYGPATAAKGLLQYERPRGLSPGPFVLAPNDRLRSAVLV